VADKLNEAINCLELFKQEGHDTLEVENMLNYLRSVRDKGAERGLSLEKYRQDGKSQIEMFRSVITVGYNALKAIFLLNGTASISLLAFIGNIWAKSPSPTSARVLAFPLLLFSLGAFSSVLATCSTWCSQDRYAMGAREGIPKLICDGHRFKKYAIAAGAISLSLFLWGILSSIHAFLCVS
jgi:hypothetical protein